MNKIIIFFVILSPSYSVISLSQELCILKNPLETVYFTDHKTQNAFLQILKRMSSSRREFIRYYENAYPANDVFAMVVALEKQAQAFGFKWSTCEQLIKKIQDECHEVIQEIEQKGTREKLEEELGDLVLANLSFCIFYRFNLKETIGQACARFQQRLNIMMDIAQSEGHLNLADIPIEVTMQYWKRTKKLKLETLSFVEQEEILEKVILLEKQAQECGLKWRNYQHLATKINDKCKEILEENKNFGKYRNLQELLGDLTLVNLSFCIFYDFSPKEVIKKSCAKFQERMDVMIDLAKSDGHTDFKNASTQLIMQYWNAAKNHIANRKAFPKL